MWSLPQFREVGPELEETHRSITEPHGARFPFTQEQELAILVLIGDAKATLVTAANLT